MLEAASYDGRRAPVTSCPLSRYVSPQNPPLTACLVCLSRLSCLSAAQAGRHRLPQSSLQRVAADGAVK